MWLIITTVVYGLSLPEIVAMQCIIEPSVDGFLPGTPHQLMRMLADLILFCCFKEEFSASSMCLKKIIKLANKHVSGILIN